MGNIYIAKPKPIILYTRKLRVCLRCLGVFDSKWAGSRICGRCKNREYKDNGSWQIREERMTIKEQDDKKTKRLAQFLHPVH